MKLVYLYIHNYQSIKQQGFLFTSEYIVNELPDAGVLRISIEDNPNHIADFFSDKITEVSAIVGVNGAGKSSVLKYISNNLTGLKFYGNYLAIIKSQGELKIETSMLSVSIEYRSKKIEPKSSLDAHQLTSRDTESAPACTSSILENFEVLKYYNGLNYNILNSRHSLRIKSDSEFSTVNRTINISTNYLLYSDSADDHVTDNKLERLDEFYYEELKRNLEYVQFHRQIHPRLVPPEVIAIRHNAKFLGFTSIPPFENSTKFSELDAYFEERLKEEKSSNPIDPNYLFLAQIRRSFLIEILNHFTEEDSIIRKIKLEFEQSTEWSYGNLTVTCFEPIFECLRIFGPTEIQEILEKLNPLLQKLSDSTNQASDTQHPLKEELFISTNSNQFNLVLEILIELRDLPPNFSRLIGFEWRTLSSGEQAFFNFLSRIFSRRKFILDSTKSNILLLIDEGDLNYHPEWQRTFLNDALELTTELFPNKNLQFIFTSNTPFIVADLPKDKVIHLDKKEEKERDLDDNLIRQFRTVVIKKDRPETFASNIHTLLANNFYLSSFLGEFAKKKIEALVEELSPDTEEIQPERLENIKKLISQVGEPIIKKRLEHLYYSKTREGIETVEDRIKRLRDEADRLEKGQKGNEDNWDTY